MACRRPDASRLLTATRTAALAHGSSRGRTLRAPAVLAAATAFTGTVEMARHIAVNPKVPERGFHPSSQPAMLILEGALFGIAVGVLYVSAPIADLRRAS